ncbi:MAG: AtpZ/AtpI family protein [Variibacter sp.]
MPDDPRKDEQPNVPSAEEAALSARLRHLGEGLGRAGVGRPVEPPSGTRGQADPSAMARGLRLSAELVGGVIVGAGLGLGFDYLVGSSPWGFIVFLLFGFAGGVLTVMRSAGVIPSRRI